MSKAIPISVRITTEDASFLAGLRLDDAVTPSDKLRALLREARQRQEQGHDYQSCQRQLQDLLAPAMQRLRQAELQVRQHSDFVDLVLPWLAETLAYAATAPATAPPEDTELLRDVEGNLATRVFRLLEGVLRLGVTRQAPCYDPDMLQSRVNTIVEIVDIMKQRRS